MEIGKLAALAVLAALCALTIKKEVPSVALVLVLVAGVVILSQAVEGFSAVIGLVDELGMAAGLVPSVLEPVVKTVGVAILVKLSCAVCKDAGANAAAAFLETAGTAAALLVALPLVKTVFDTLKGLL